MDIIVYQQHFTSETRPTLLLLYYSLKSCRIKQPSSHRSSPLRRRARYATYVSILILPIADTCCTVDRSSKWYNSSASSTSTLLLNRHSLLPKVQPIHDPADPARRQRITLLTLGYTSRHQSPHDITTITTTRPKRSFQEIQRDAIHDCQVAWW